MDIYQASAGSGKTFTLAREYIRMVLGDLHHLRQTCTLPHAHILAVTFTKKATAEMKERILKELNLLACEPEKSAYYDDFIKDPHLPSTKEELQSVSRLILIGILQDYTSFAVSTIDGFFQQVIRRFAHELGLPASFEVNLDGDEVVEMAIDDLLSEARAMPKTEQSEWLKSFAMQNINEQRKWNPKDAIIRFSKQLLREDLQVHLPKLHQFFEDKTLLADYCEALRQVQQEDDKIRANTATCILKNIYQLGLIQDVATHIQIANRELNRLPIAEINSMLARLIDNSEAPFIYEKTGQFLHHFMIDEFQDTSQLQWANFSPLIHESEANGRANLIVGDTKQSIYRWRNSDWHLLEQVPSAFPDARLPLMKKNFRSSAVVVRENNALFSAYRDQVALLMDKNFPSEHSYGDMIRHLYSDERMHQEPVKSFGGRFRLQFFEGKREEVEAASLDAMLPLLQELQAQGVTMGHVAMLVRKRNEAQQVATFLTAHGYQVQSADGLLIEAHPAIRLLLAILQTQNDSENALLRYQIAQLLGHEPTQEEQDSIYRARSLALYDQVQALIDDLHLPEWENSLPYIQAFQDCIYHFIVTHVADVTAFLDYWEHHHNSLTISTPDTDTAIRIMTIHASKGLEFDHVFIPFLSWPLAKTHADDILWCVPKQEPFNRLPIVPVNPTASLMGKSLFAEEYAQEMQSQYVDNLNLTYVAFTRAVRGLYAFGMSAPQLKTKRKQDTVGHLLSIIYETRLTNGVYEVCSAPSAPLPAPCNLRDLTDGRPTVEKTVNDTLSIPAEYHSVDAFPRLVLRPCSREATELGNRMHEVLAGIRTRQDVPPDMQADMQAFWDLVAPYDWFDEGKTVYLEHDLLCANGATYRPDRVVIDGNKATIIDYKFGHEKRHQYLDQVRDYMTLYAQMGYQPCGYIVYVTLNEIVPV